MMRKVFIWSILFLIISLSSSVFAKEEWKEAKSQHFFVYYQNTPKDFVDEVLKAAEDYYDQITDNLGFVRYKGWSFDNRAKIYIYDNHEQYVNSASQSNWSAGAAYYHSRTIRTFPSATGFFDSLLPHELGHIIFHEFIGANVSIPTWFDEGVAIYQEKAKQWGANQKVRDAIKSGTFIPLQELNKVRLTTDSSQEEVELFYAEAASSVYFLIHEHGTFKFSNFCRQLQGGNKFLHAFELAYPYFMTLKRFNAAWVDYLER